MRLPSFLGCLTFCFLYGCSSGPALHPAAGVVTLNDKALDGAIVRFFPQGNTPGHGGEGCTDAEGKYEITAANNNNRKGLPAGAYKVVISRMRRPDGSMPPPDVRDIESDAKETVPEPYSSLRDTPLTMTIGDDGKTCDFHLPVKKK